MPDTDFKNSELIARAAQTPAEVAKLRNEEKQREDDAREQQSRDSTMPRVSARDNKGERLFTRCRPATRS